MRHWITYPIAIACVMLMLAGCAQEVKEAEGGPTEPVPESALAASSQHETPSQSASGEAKRPEVVELSSANFDSETSSGIVLVDFWAPWCGPCRIQGPIIDEVAREAPEGVKVAKLNVDTAKDISQRFAIRTIPRLIVFRDGEIIEEYNGVTPKKELLGRSTDSRDDAGACLTPLSPPSTIAEAERGLSMARRPNILLITTDQQRGDCLGCDGHPAVETPYLDELAADGARFTHAYTAVPSCTPARAGVLTGMNQWNHGRLTMRGDDAHEYPATLPGELGKAGYQTQAVGKMHFAPQRRLYGFHNMLLDESGRRDPGFLSDYHRWFEQNKDGPYHYRDYSIDWNSWMARPSHLPEHLHPTYWTAEQSIWFLEQRDPTKPFFLWMSFARPHSPYDPPRPYWDQYIDSPDIPEPVIGDWCGEFDRKIADVNAAFTHRSDREVRRARAGYYGNITFIDHQIGRVLYELRRHQRAVWDNTLILFHSDHGDMMGDHYHWRKTYAYEGSARVPFLMRFPKAWSLDRGQVLDQPIEQQDIMPTLLDAAGVSIPESVDGRSLLDLARGDAAGWREFVMGEHTESYAWDWNYGMQYVTDGREKYVWFHAAGKEHFFDLEADPQECHDLAQDPDAQPRIERWRKRLAEVNEQRGDPRGQDGRLVVQPDGGISLSPNYDKWKRRAEELMAD